MKLGRLFILKPRRHPQKKGRELVVVYNKRFPVIKGFENRYSYLVRFLDKRSVAGNHYHIKKHEIFVPVFGKFEICLEDIKTGVRKTITISADAYHMLYIKPKISHKVMAKNKNAVLLVIASATALDTDEYHYEIR